MKKCTKDQTDCSSCVGGTIDLAAAVAREMVEDAMCNAVIVAETSGGAATTGGAGSVACGAYFTRSSTAHLHFAW